MKRFVALVVIVLMVPPEIASGNVTSKTVREAAEFIIERFGAEAAEETVETLSVKIGKYASRYGEDAVPAIQRAGPQAFKLLDDAGENAPQVIQLLNRYGNEAVWVASRPKSLAIFVKYGEPAAGAMIKHPGVAEPILKEFGTPAAKALESLSGQNARRLAMLQNDGELATMAGGGELFNVVAKYGDPAMDFIWRNKGSLTVAAGLTAFLADPEPFINGVAEPIAAVPGEFASHAAKSTNWTVVLTVIVVVVGGLAGLRWWHRAA